MAITFTINVGGGANPLTHSSIGSSTSRTLTINSISGDDSNNVSDYSFTWYFIDKPTSTNSTITNDTGLHPDKNVVTVNSIDQWGTYRIFCIARHKGTNNRSESNPLKAPESSFFNIRVQGPNFDLEKPAKGQRNWQDQYNTLIQTVSDNMTAGSGTSYTDADARTAISVTDSGGDGSLSYDNNTGVITYAGPSATEVRAHFSAGTGIGILNGQISSTITQYTDADARTAISVTDSGGDGSLSYDNGTGVITYAGPSATEVRSHFSAGTGISITNGEIAATGGSSGDFLPKLNPEATGSLYVFRTGTSDPYFKIEPENSNVKIGSFKPRSNLSSPDTLGSNLSFYGDDFYFRTIVNSHLGDTSIARISSDSNNNLDFFEIMHNQVSTNKVSGFKLSKNGNNTYEISVEAAHINTSTGQPRLSSRQSNHLTISSPSDIYYQVGKTSSSELTTRPIHHFSIAQSSSPSIDTNCIKLEGNGGTNTDPDGYQIVGKPPNNKYFALRNPQGPVFVGSDKQGQSLTLYTTDANSITETSAPASNNEATKVIITSAQNGEVQFHRAKQVLTSRRHYLNLKSPSDSDVVIESTNGFGINLVASGSTDFAGKFKITNLGIAELYGSGATPVQYLSFFNSTTGNFPGSVISTPSGKNLVLSAPFSDDVEVMFGNKSGAFKIADNTGGNRFNVLQINDSSGLDVHTAGPIEIKSTSVSLGSGAASSTIFIGYTNQANTVNIGNSTVGGGSTVNIGSTSNPSAHQINLNAQDIRIPSTTLENSGVNELVIGKEAFSGRLYHSNTLTMFTGGHIYKCSENISLSSGDVVCLNNDNLVLPISSNMKTVCGIVSKIQEATISEPIETSLGETVTSGFCARVASVGDNRHKDCEGFKVCNENGPIEAGDLLVTSSRPGYLMKQDDDIIRSKTVGKSMIDVVFDQDGLATNIYGFIYCG